MRPRRRLRLDSRRTVPLERFRRYKKQGKLLKVLKARLKMRRMSVIAARWRQSVWLVALLLLGVCLAPASPAAADSYHDFLCRIPYGPHAGRAAPADDVTYATNGDYVYCR